MLNILICDDNKKQVELLNKHIQNFENTKMNISFSTHSTYSSIEALKYIKSIDKIDIAILDIEIDETTGIELAKHLIEKNNNTLIIFETNYDSYAYSAYEIEAFDYLLKPISYEKFTKTFNKVISNIARNNFLKKYMLPKLTIKFKGEISNISQKDIIYIEKVGKKVIIYTKNKSFEYTVNLKDLEKILDENLFIRCHSGFIVNTDYITAYKKSQVYLSNKFIVPVSKANISKILNILEKKLWEN